MRLFPHLLVVLLLAACNAQSEKPSGPTEAASTTQAPAEQQVSPQPAPPSKAELTSEDFSIKKGQFGNKEIRGSIRNNTDRTYSYVQIEFNLYDSDGSQVGSTLANVNNLQPGGVWKYSAPIMEEHVAKAEIMKVTAF